LSAYRLSRPYEHPPLHRRASGIALAVGINLALLLALLTLGRFAPELKKTASRGLVVDLIPNQDSEETMIKAHTEAKHAPSPSNPTPQPEPPPIALPSKPTIALPRPAPSPPKKPSPWIEMSKADLDAGNIASLPRTVSARADSEVVGKGPHGETLYAAQWAREPTDAELNGYLPSNAPEGYGIIACRTVPGNRVDDCVELDQEPHGSRLASAIRQAAWQFRVRPPRKNGVPLVGSWVSIRIDYQRVGGSTSGL
jgi:protein TonB